jgi:hypothetical protein
MRNIDKIKNMTVDEMADLLTSYSTKTDLCDDCLAYVICGEAKLGSCRETIRQWLLKECE